MEDLTEVGRIARGDFRLDMAACDLGAIALRAADIARPGILKRRQSLVEPDPEVRCPVTGDARRLTQALSNLLINASKYTPEGGKIELRARVEGSNAVAEVADDGIGIDPARLTRIFDLFSQEPAGRSLSQGGLGIGLTVVERVAALHGGAVEAMSSGPGLGSLFRLVIPLAPASV